MCVTKDNIVSKKRISMAIKVLVTTMYTQFHKMSIAYAHSHEKKNICDHTGYVYHVVIGERRSKSYSEYTWARICKSAHSTRSGIIANILTGPPAPTERNTSDRRIICTYLRLIHGKHRFHSRDTNSIKLKSGHYSFKCRGQLNIR